MLVPSLFVHFSDAVSLSQSRRAAGFLPFAFAFAGGLALLARRPVLVPAALVAGIVLELLWPGDFGYGLRHGGPALATWIALVGGARRAGARRWSSRAAPLEPRYGSARARGRRCSSLPVAVHGFAHWSPRATDRSERALARARRSACGDVPKGAVVIAPIRDELRDRRRRAGLRRRGAARARREHEGERPVRARTATCKRWLATGDPAIPRSYGATWADPRTAASIVCTR